MCITSNELNPEWCSVHGKFASCAARLRLREGFFELDHCESKRSNWGYQAASFESCRGESHRAARSGRGDSDLASWRGKARTLCVAVLRMLLGSLCFWRDTSSKALSYSRSKISPGSTELQPFQSRRQEQNSRKLGKKIGMMREWPVGGMWVLRLALLCCGSC